MEFIKKVEIINYDNVEKWIKKSFTNFKNNNKKIHIKIVTSHLKEQNEICVLAKYEITYQDVFVFNINEYGFYETDWGGLLNDDISNKLKDFIREIQDKFIPMFKKMKEENE